MLVSLFEESRRRAPVLLLLWLLLQAGAAAAAADPVSVDGAWARSSSRAHVVFVYLTISLAKDEKDVLIGASSVIADKVDILDRMSKGRGESLEPVLALDLDTHAPTVLQPGEAHLILRGVKKRLKPGDSFPVTLRFANAGSRDVTVKLVELPPSADMPLVPKGIKFD